MARLGSAQTQSNLQRPSAQLVVLAGPEVGRKYMLSFPAVLGRDPAAMVVIDDGEISRRHAQILFVAGDFLLEDLGSKNGTFLGDVPVQKAVILQLGDRIALGSRVRLLFTQHDPQAEQLLQRQRLELLGRLAAGVAHDLNNVLCVALASAEFLRTGRAQDLDAADARESIEDLHLALSQAAQLTPRLLELAKSEPQRDGVVDVGRLCQEAAALARRSFGASVVVSCVADRGLSVQGSAVELHQVLMNLCVNARDSMPQGGRLNISAEGERWQNADVVMVRVEDTGSGMDEATRARVFEPFFTTKRGSAVAGGLGLGLATVKEVVVKHGGEVTVTSQPGHGSTFAVRLPRFRVVRRRATAAHMAAVAGSRGRGGTILIIDDDASLCRAMSRVLRAAGYQADVARTGIEGVERWRSASPRPALVVLDEELPDMPGSEVRKSLRAADPEVRILRMSGNPGLIPGRQVLAKPWSTEAMLDAVERAMAAPSSERPEIVDEETADAPVPSGTIPGD
jgi:signal transduction histidine kinase/ActR/RegA family two-component response regulator